MRKNALDSVEPRLANACGNSRNNSFKASANAVALFLCGCYCRLHSLRLFVVKHCELHSVEPVDICVYILE